MIVGIDMDGVVAEFTRGFRTIANRLHGVPIHSNVDQKTWEYHDLTPAQEDACWREVEKSPTFWYDLAPLEPESILDLQSFCNRHEVYFVTNRFGNNARRQTENWLGRYGIRYPNVVRAGRKGSIIRDIRADYFIDDKPGNILDVVKTAPKVSVAVRDWEYNRREYPDRVFRVSSLKEFMGVVDRV